MRAPREDPAKSAVLLAELLIDDNGLPTLELDPAPGSLLAVSEDARWPLRTGDDAAITIAVGVKRVEEDCPVPDRADSPRLNSGEGIRSLRVDGVVG